MMKSGEEKGKTRMQTRQRRGGAEKKISGINRRRKRG